MFKVNGDGELNLASYNQIDENIMVKIGYINNSEFYKNLILMSINGKIHRSLLTNYLSKYYSFKHANSIIAKLAVYDSITCQMEIFSDKRSVFRKNKTEHVNERGKYLIHCYELKTFIIII